MLYNLYISLIKTFTKLIISILCFDISYSTSLQERRSAGSMANDVKKGRKKKFVNSEYVLRI